MAGLIELSDLVETITIGRKSVPVRGLSAAGIASLLGRFPEIRKMLSGGKVEITVETVAELGPQVVAAILADGLEIDVDLAAKLPAGVQLDVLEAMVRLTMPGGLDPFVDRLAAMMGGGGQGRSGAALATSSPS